MTINHSEDTFAGRSCLSVSSGRLTLHALKDAGPRIVGLQVDGGANLMAEVPQKGEDAQDFIPLGGQRLWHGPEDPIRTYQPDNEPVSYEFTESGLILTQKTEAATGIQKSIEIEMAAGRAEVLLKHGLQNHNLWPISLAAWPICQMRVGGFAILPLSNAPTGLLPNRRLVFWPYTDVTSENIRFGNQFILVKAGYQGQEKAKIGWLNDRGWIGYYLDRTLFIKQAPYFPGAEYVDLGCSMECYADIRFLELETMSPLSRIEPGERFMFEEKWLIYTNLDLRMEEEDVKEVITGLNLE